MIYCSLIEDADREFLINLFFEYGFYNIHISTESDTMLQEVVYSFMVAMRTKNRCSSALNIVKYRQSVDARVRLVWVNMDIDARVRLVWIIMDKVKMIECA